MQPAFPFVDASTPVQFLATMITPEQPALLIRDFKTQKTFIITRSDIIRVLDVVRDRRGRCEGAGLAGTRSAVGPERSPGQVQWDDHWSVGRSTRSITNTFTGPLADSSLRPSCSCRA